MTSRVPLFATLLLAACASQNPRGPGSPSSEGAGTSSTASAAPRDPKTAHITVVGLSDFHGWLLPLEPKTFSKFYGGIANIGGMLEHKEKLDPSSSVILDNGDMWTGPTESTFLKGEPVIQAYNELGLTAANIANHEFDFGQDVLSARVQQAKFPFLGANIVRAGGTERPSFAKGFTVVERDGIKIGIVGLAGIDTPETTLAKYIAGLEFKPYVDTLKLVLPELKKAGAELVVLLLHDSVEAAERMLSANPDLGVSFVIAGQTHRRGEAVVGSTPIVNPGPFGRSYVRFDVAVDRASKKLSTPVKYEIVDVSGDIGAPTFAPEPKLVAIAESARQRTESLSKEPLGHLAEPLPVGSFGESPLGNLITDAWLGAVPKVDVAICNHGAIRQPLAAGPVTIGDLMSVLPFENNLYVVQLTGKQLKAELATDKHDGPSVAGITWKYKQGPNGRTVLSVVDRRGQPISDSKTYRVIINDFMYTGGDGYAFKELDAKPEDTGLSLREPIMRVLRAAEAASHPVEVMTTARAAKAR
jgi:2',3'-cyclic-nucleotide 2'-phosphodiesterase/3'-nucleotidase